MRVLIVEDKVRMASLLDRAIAREGYRTVVAHDGEAALAEIERHCLDAIVMDVMLPRLDGFDVLVRMRELGVHVPTILLTARDTSHDIVRGLDLGADDYLTKPFDLAVLLARLRALTRRKGSGERVEPDLRVGGLVLRQPTHDVVWAGRAVGLTPMEYTLLEALMQRAGQVVRKETLASIGWGEDEDFHEATLYVFMRALRNKLHTADTPDLVHTVRGVGYMLKVANA